MADSQNQKSTIKVVDHRRVDERGEDRRSEADAADTEKRDTGNGQATPGDKRTSQSSEPDHVQHALDSGTAKFEEGKSDGGMQHVPQVNFSSFVISLATQALMHMGEMPPPEGIQVTVDRGAAKHTIDSLAMFADRTKGNLDAAEAQLMEDVLHRLRFGFLKRS